mgnify:CR=1 FL=1
MRFTALILCVLCLLAGCAPDPEIVPVTATATPVPLCGIWITSDDNVTCIRFGADGMLVQSSSEQVTLNAYALSIVLSGTVAIVKTVDLRIINLEGDVIVGAGGQNRVLRPGREVTVPIVDDAAQIPSEITQLARIPLDLPLNDLPRAINVNGLVPTVTPIPSETPTASPTPDICFPPQDWTRVYIIEEGDTLERIARRFNLETDDLAIGNCLDDISRITVGQELFLPPDAEATESPESTESLTTFSIAIGFRADAYAIPAGTCTILRWDVVDAEAIYLDDVSVGTVSMQEICPEETTSYTLFVQFPGDRQEVRELTISVSP